MACHRTLPSASEVSSVSREHVAPGLIATGGVQRTTRRPSAPGAFVHMHPSSGNPVEATQNMYGSLDIVWSFVFEAANDATVMYWWSKLTLFFQLFIAIWNELLSKLCIDKNSTQYTCGSSSYTFLEIVLIFLCGNLLLKLKQASKLCDPHWCQRQEFTWVIVRWLEETAKWIIGHYIH